MRIYYLCGTKNDRTDFLFNSYSKILIIGTSGSGKTTLAKLFCEKYNLHNIELDALFWNADWVGTENEEFRIKIQKEIDYSTGYVIHGNYNKVRDLTWGNCNTIIWLDYSRFLVMYRIIKRTIIRLLTKEKLWKENTETFKKSFLSKDSIILWAWKTYSIRKKQYQELLQADEYKINQFIIIRNPKTINKLFS